MKILTTSRPLTEVEQYLMTISPAILSMKDVKDGTSIDVVATLTFEDTKENGETTTILSIMDSEKKVYSCQSDTFKRSLADISAIMGDKAFAIIKTSGTTKSGRPYINCELDVTKLA